MESPRTVTRRVAIKDLGKAGLAVMVFGTACTTETSPTTLGNTSTTSPGQSTTTPGETTTSASRSDVSGTEWARVNMGFVSAYVLYRNGEAALVDTGQSGAESDIEGALSSVGLGWDSVSNVILTHRHPDHAGSVNAVAAAASASTVFIGSGDASAIGDLPNGGPRIAGDGDDIFGLTIIETPGHTLGHISVLDPVAGILVAGDAVNSNGGTLNSSDPAFTDDEALAASTIKKLAGFEYEIILPGHGDPVLSDDSVQMTALAAGIPD